MRLSIGRIALLAIIATLVTVAAPAHAIDLLTEGFDNVAGLAGNGYVLQNNGTPVGLIPNWIQGDTAVFAAQSGAANSYIGGSFNTVTGANTISLWLLTPNLTFQNGDTVSFFTRKATPNPTDFPDRLEVRFSTAGASSNVGANATSVGDFTTTLLVINPTLVAGGYPTGWTQQTITITGLAAPTSGRLGFRYFVTNGGPDGANSDFIGIDTLSVSRVATVIPEAGTLALALPALGLIGAFVLRRRK